MPGIIDAVIGICQDTEDFTTVDGERVADGVDKVIDAARGADRKFRQAILPAKVFYDMLVVFSLNEENPFRLYIRH